MSLYLIMCTTDVENCMKSLNFDKKTIKNIKNILIPSMVTDINASDIIDELKALKKTQDSIVCIVRSTSHGLVIKEISPGTYEINYVDNGLKKSYSNKLAYINNRCITSFLTIYDGDIKYLWERDEVS